jgi:hypothetical protein
MTNDSKPPMFGPSSMFDPSTYEPRSGKSALTSELMAELAGKPDALAATIISNCTTTLPMRFKFDPKDNGHTIVFGTTREGMGATPAFIADYSALRLTDAEIAKVRDERD